jgi:Uma2 family endonuclease
MGIAAIITEEEFLNLPDRPGKRELLDGELIELPPAKHSHSVISKRFVRRLESILDDSRVWIETAFQLGKDRWLIPDISVSWPDQAVINDWFQGAPMLAIEIASRGNTAEEIDRKAGLYLESGAAEVWVVYPKTDGMVVFRADSTSRIPAGASYHCELIGLTVTSEDRMPMP